MKRAAFILAIIVPFLLCSLTGCEKGIDGTGTLIVHISNLEYDTDVRVYPYGFTDHSLPIVSKNVKKGKNRSASFILNTGDYVIEANGTKTVQIQEGQESHVYFN